MTMGRKQLIDNLERVAQELINYTLTESNHEDILGAIQAVHEVYQGPVKSWVTGWVYQFTRTRGSQLEGVAATLQQHASATDLLEGIKNLFKEGGWQATSLNTLLMNQLVLNLKQYKINDTSLSDEILESISRQFIDKAERHIIRARAQEKLAAMASEKKDTSAEAPEPVESIKMDKSRFEEIRLRIADMYKARENAARLGEMDFDDTVAAPKPLAEEPKPNKLDEAKYAEVRKALSQKYAPLDEPKLDANAVKRPEGIGDVRNKYAKGVTAVMGMFAKRNPEKREVGKLKDTYAEEMSMVEKVLGGGPKV